MNKKFFLLMMFSALSNSSLAVAHPLVFSDQETRYQTLLNKYNQAPSPATLQDFPDFPMMKTCLAVNSSEPNQMVPLNGIKIIRETLPAKPSVPAAGPLFPEIPAKAPEDIKVIMLEGEALHFKVNLKKKYKYYNVTTATDLILEGQNHKGLVFARSEWGYQGLYNDKIMMRTAGEYTFFKVIFSDEDDFPGQEWIMYMGYCY